MQTTSDSSIAGNWDDLQSRFERCYAELQEACDQAKDALEAIAGLKQHCADLETRIIRYEENLQEARYQAREALDALVELKFRRGAETVS
jgi:predicted  nucleic acid-binding Zn-ribbon protein